MSLLTSKNFILKIKPYNKFLIPYVAGNPEPIVQWYINGRIDISKEFSQSKAGEVIEKR